VSFFFFEITSLVNVLLAQGSSLYRPSTKTKRGGVQSSSSKSDPFLLDVGDASECYLCNKRFLSIYQLVRTVPIYDARLTDFNMQRDLNARGDLPMFEGEIPKQSFVQVAYTASVYRSTKDGRWHFSANLLWAIVMGTPKSK